MNIEEAKKERFVYFTCLIFQSFSRSDWMPQLFVHNGADRIMHQWRCG
jgi:hypothetical protein